ncbi:Ig-like domain repeat protein [Salinispora tropica]|uniref:LPXTG-motif cell wall anchor domain n=1 Tax=Salinispora tropica (strain ATCC BAA-916 / DSM 44818 / JCM 13857 / NBRC 105044 / CNB-440) TaxID=369723 RepID=A4X7E7_SALTO|nr:Ig-like domain repeat protein [Salinispora tropica]ABP54797.1 LPXTG-motif cell wall anchor domain [Salinispora tropica CNB-440]
MQGIRQRDLRDACAHRARRALAGGFCLALVVTVTQAAGVLPAGAQRTPTAAVATDTILAWGDNSFGQFGNGTTASSRTPVPVRLPVGTTVTAIAGSDTHSLALTSVGTVLAWGGNSFGQLGDGTTASSRTPVPVRLPVGTTVTAIAAGTSHSLAITATGAVFAWGDNAVGQLGDGTTTDSSLPVPVRLPVGTTVTAIAGGLGHSLAVASTGATLAWGSNAFGQLGDGTTTGSSTPITVPQLPTVTAVAAGDVHSLALTSTGTVYAWGANSFGQLGDGSTSDSSTPIAVRVPAGTTATAVVSGADHSLALTAAGGALAWGDNGQGQLGNGATVGSSTPVAVRVPGGATLTAVAIHRDHAVAVTSTATALAWSRNNEGQLGNGTTTDSSEPVAVSLPAGTAITAVAVGDDHSLALVDAQATSTTTLRISPPDPTVDQEVTLTATVSCDIAAPTGSITFRTNNTDLATVPLDSSSTATHTTRLPAGANTLTAAYTSTTTCPNSQSAATTVTIADPDLPITGASLPHLLGAAAVLILAGAALLHLARRPRSHQPR